VIAKKKTKINKFPQHGYQMVEVNLIPIKLFHSIVITNLHYNMHTFTIFVLILNTFDFVVH
jgi:hypothetical protein